MEQTVKVLTCAPDGTAQVLRVRESACSGDCHKCSGCGAAKQNMILTAVNPIGAKPGDTVVIRCDSGPVLAHAAVLYLMPLVLFIGGYLAGEHLWQMGPLVGGIGFVLAVGAVIAYDRLVVKKKKTEYTITGFEHGLGS